MPTLELFHGSPYPFEQFQPSRAGLHFGTFDQAAQAATLKLARMPVEEFAQLEDVRGWQGNIYLCSVTVGHSKHIKDPRTPQAWSRQIKKARQEGFDSIVYRNHFEGKDGEDSYCVFTPEEVAHIERVR